MFLLYITFTILIFALVTSNAVKWSVWGGVTGVLVIGMILVSLGLQFWRGRKRSKELAEAWQISAAQPPLTILAPTELAPNIPRDYIDRANAKRGQCREVENQCLQESAQRKQRDLHNIEMEQESKMAAIIKQRQQEQTDAIANGRNVNENLMRDLRDAQREAHVEAQLATATVTRNYDKQAERCSEEKDECLYAASRTQAFDCAMSLQGQPSAKAQATGRQVVEEMRNGDYSSGAVRRALTTCDSVTAK